MFKICVIGCGWVANFGHGPSYQKYAANNPDVELSACCDVDDKKSIRFKESDLRSMGRVAEGNIGIRMGPEDCLVGMEVLGEEEATVLTVTENGYGKRTRMEEYRRQARGGKGILTIKTTERNGPVVYSYQVTDQDELMIITGQGKIIRLRVGDISVIGRNTQGVKLINLGEGEKVVGVAKVVEEE